jgi:hypothetical protein
VSRRRRATTLVLGPLTMAASLLYLVDAFEVVDVAGAGLLLIAIPLLVTAMWIALTGAGRARR